VSENRNRKAIKVGLLAEEPLRLEGLTSIFHAQPEDGHPPLHPVTGSLQELLGAVSLDYLVVDLPSTPGGLRAVENIRRARPDLRLIVIGPDGNDDLVMDAIIAGARAYLDSNTGPQGVRHAIGEVAGGSIFAPRRVLSKLIDRLLSKSDTSPTNANPHLTDRERQVLEQILKARSNREIARHLGIEERTVKSHVSRLMRKTGVDNRIELSIRAFNRSMVPGTGGKEREGAPRRRPPEG
jgi:DNA-binding NarL/FixJ family response regulator